MPQGRTRYRKQRGKLLKKSSKKTRRKRMYKGGIEESSLLPPPPLTSQSIILPPSTPAPSKRPRESNAPTKYGIPLPDFERKNIDVRFPQQLKRSILNMQSTDENTNVFNSEEMVKGLGHKDFMNYVFDNVDANLRKTMESLSASEQCRKTIGTCNDCICWICGTPIQASPPPECDHILPIARSILFSGIKTTKKMEKQASSFGENPDSQKIMDYFKLSYAYAHKNCNQKKSDIVLIRWDEPTKSIVYNTKQGCVLSEKITTEVLGKPKESADTKETKEKLYGVYKEKIERLLGPINQEIKHILDLTDGNMDVFWAYTIEIMKTYIAYENLVENERLQGEKLKRARYSIGTTSDIDIERLITEDTSSPTEDTSSPTEDDLRETAVQNLGEYRKQRLKALKSVKEKLMSKFSSVSRASYPPSVVPGLTSGLRRSYV
jgi:5-methylcytosine-specific restriction endonuclease McrA